MDEYWGSQSASLTVADFVKRREEQRSEAKRREAQILKWPFLGVGALGYLSLVHRSLIYGPLVYICGLPCEPCGRLCVDPRPGGGIGCQPYCDGQFCLASARVDNNRGRQAASQQFVQSSRGGEAGAKRR